MIVTFKSKPEFYRKEFYGDKPNTFRKIDDSDKRFKVLKNFNLSAVDYKPSHICIENSETYEHFIRPITDVSIYRGWMIISWEHKNEN